MLYFPFRAVRRSAADAPLKAKALRGSRSRSVTTITPAMLWSRERSPYRSRSVRTSMDRRPWSRRWPPGRATRHAGCGSHRRRERLDPSAGIAAAHGIEMSSHLLPEISAHLLAASPTCHYLEYVDWADPILDPRGAAADPGWPRTRSGPSGHRTHVEIGSREGTVAGPLISHHQQ